jgi:hypothetical protein
MEYLDCEPLHLASWHKNEEAFKLILERMQEDSILEKEINRMDSLKFTPMFLVCSSGMYKSCKLLVKNKADLKY